MSAATDQVSIAADVMRRIAGASATEYRNWAVDSIGGLRGPRDRGGAVVGEFNPLDPAVRADPAPAYARLHARGRLHYSDRTRVYYVIGYDDVREAARAHASLSSASGVTNPPVPLPTIITTDPPDHSRLRKLVAKDFTRGALDRWRADAEEIAHRRLGALIDGGAEDVVPALSSPLPVEMIARVLGVPASDLADFRRWSDWASASQTIESLFDDLPLIMRATRATFNLHRYFHRHIAQLRARPGDDLLSRLLGASEDGQLSDEELVWFAVIFLIAGNETTSNLLSTMTLAFAQNPEQYAAVRADPDALIDRAIDESLRWMSPIQGIHRVAIAPHAVGDATIPVGGRVALMFGAANHDPSRYENPARFDIHRDAKDHVGFGLGIHFCLGAHLARLEARVVLRAMVDRVERIEPAGPARWNGNPMFRGLETLPVRMVAAS